MHIVMMRTERNKSTKIKESPQVNLPGLPTDRVRPHQTACGGFFSIYTTLKAYKTPRLFFNILKLKELNYLNNLKAYFNI